MAESDPARTYPSEMPVLALRQTVVFPLTLQPLAISRPLSIDSVNRALFAKLRDYMIRVDDAVTCKACGKKFDIPSQHSMVFIQKGDNAPDARAAQSDDASDSRFNR